MLDNLDDIHDIHEIPTFAGRKLALIEADEETFILEALELYADQLFPTDKL